MEIYAVGDYIREVRIRKGYTQEEVSFGICTTASLSRIENNSQTPSKRKLDKILERLGIEDSGFTSFLNKRDLELYQNIQVMSRSIADGKIDEIEKQIMILESIMNIGVESEQQYLLWAKAILLRKKGGNSDKVLNMLLESIHITLPNFDGKTPLKSNLLTFDEIMIINSIAIQYNGDGKISEALKLGFWLKEYIEEKIIDGKMKMTKYPAIVYDLSNWLGKVGRYADALKVADDGVEYCIKFGNLVILPVLLFNKACALAELGEFNEAKEIFTQSIVIFQTMKQDDKAKMAIEWCKDNYKIII